MGDMADLALEYGADDDDIYSKISNNPLALMEYGFADELGYEYAYIRRTKTCRCCGTNNLQWGNVNGKWLLHTNEGKLHNCQVNPYNASISKNLGEAGDIKR